jgi:hypothetical protein
MGVTVGTASVNVEGEVKRATVDTSGAKTLDTVVVTADRIREYGFPNLVPNPLEKFASYTTLFTMAALDPEQYNNPITLRNNPASLKNVIFSSAGRYDKERVLAEPNLRPEYYVDSFKMTNLIAPRKELGLTNAIGFTMEIYEPYSMGLFLQSLQVAALNAGYLNYLNNAPYLIQIDFLGFDENGNSYIVRNLTRQFGVTLIGIDFDVNEGGSTYKIEMSPHNHKGFTSIINSVWTDIRIQGGTIKELLTSGENSLSVALTKESTRMAANAQQALADTFVVTFPQTDGKSSGDNIIANTSMAFDMTRGGNYTFGKESEVVSPDGRIRTSQITIDPNSRALQFGQGQTIVDIITEVILASEYGKKAIQNIDGKGLIDWFKINVKIQLKDYDVSRGDYQKTIIYEVYPYKVHSSIFLKPNAAGTGYSELQKIIAKKYNYIYTGQNNDLLKFDLRFNTTFYTAISPGLKEETASTDASQQAASDANQVKVATLPSARQLLSKTATPRFAKDGTVMAYKPGGANNDDVAAAVARDFQNAVLSSNVDLIEMEFEILGDPYFLVDSGVGNYYGPPSTDNPSVTIDGGMTYETNQVYVYVSFNTPLDIDEGSGVYDVKTVESPFSGIYMITEVETTISKDAVFRQTLKAVRMKGQPKDFDTAISGTAADSKPASEIGEVPSNANFNPSTGDANEGYSYVA